MNSNVVHRFDSANLGTAADRDQKLVNQGMPTAVLLQ